MVSQGNALDTHMTQILRPREVFKRTGLSRSQIYADIAAGKFPKPIRLSARRVGFVEEEIENWILERIRVRDETKSSRT